MKEESQNLEVGLQDEVVLSDEERQKCEVWTRVMGYHRPVESFNVGKKGEHAERLHFKESLCGLTNSGRHIGTVAVVDTEVGVVFQNTGRGDIAAHDLKQFEKTPGVGERLDLQYVNGVAKVSGLGDKQQKEVCR